VLRVASTEGNTMPRLHVTRDSVAADDEVLAPHAAQLDVPDVPSAVDVVKEVLLRNYLPSISGGMATWVGSSREPFAVCAQQWMEPKSIRLPKSTEWLSSGSSGVRLHFSYLVQVDPDVVLKILNCCTFNASAG
jgi:hypothetical protein